VTVTVLKLGGELIETRQDLARTAGAVAALARTSRLVIVHGGGKAIDAELVRRGIEPVKRDGIRVTDAPTLDTAVAVLAGTANTALVAALGARGLRAVGLTGADDGLGLSERVSEMKTLSGAVVDPGLVGRPIGAGTARLIDHLSAAGFVPVIASIGVTAGGELLNVNADVMAAHVAAAAGAARLLIAGGTAGVLDAGGRVIEALDGETLEAMLADGSASAGMIAKLRACRAACDAGVADVRIVDGRDPAFASGTVIDSAPSRQTA
jgi:acetylglutamate kinase